MATSGPTNVPSNMAGDADFRLFCQAVAAKLTALGLVQTADTGQINNATVLRPLANASAGFEIWRFADSLQATMPVFIKVEYGCNTAVDRLALWVTVGTNTNGAGTVTGQLTARNLCGQGNSDVAGTVRPMIAAGGVGEVHLFANINPAGVTGPGLIGFAVARTRDGSGNATGDGIIVMWCSTGGTLTFQQVPVAGTIPAASVPYIAPNAGRSTVGNDVIVSPVLLFFGKIFYSLMGIMNAVDLGGDNVFTATALGSTHTFRTVLSNPGSWVIPWE